MKALQLFKKCIAKGKIILLTKKGHPHWKRILRKDLNTWNNSLKASQNGPKILIATSTGGHTASTTVESLLAVALTLRGFEVHILLCDKYLPACLHSNLYNFPYNKLSEFIELGPLRRLCNNCFQPAYKMFTELGFQVHKYSDYIKDEEYSFCSELSEKTLLKNLPDYKYNGISVGEHALAGTLRFYASGNLNNQPFAEKILRKYFKASLLTTFVSYRLIKSFDFKSTCFNHGIYVPQGLIGEVARKEMIPVSTWNPAYRKKCFIFSHNDTYHHTMLSEPTSNWEKISLTPQIEDILISYLKSRWQGKQDWIWFHEKPQIDINTIAKELGVDFSKATIGMLTNVMWDAQLHYKANAFPNMLDWALRTIKYFESRRDLQLIIRIHPAEIRGTIPSRQPLLVELHKFFPKLPENVFIIPPESRVSTYAAMQECNAVIIYGTKTGVELTSMGIPVIVAGEAWIRNKGITMDAQSPEEYFNLLDRLPLKEKLSDNLQEKARKYAYHFFFRRMIPISCMIPTNASPPFQIKAKSINEFRPGNDPGLDVICNGIIDGTEFIFPAENLIHHVMTPSE